MGRRLDGGGGGGRVVRVVERELGEWGDVERV